jgi:hypothetical protein
MMSEATYRCCASGLVWRVFDEYQVAGVVHVRIRRVDQSSEVRTLARSVINDHRRFEMLSAPEDLHGSSLAMAAVTQFRARPVNWNFQQIALRSAR